MKASTAFDHHPSGTKFQRFNKTVALAITRTVGDMRCAYFFVALALVSLPSAIASHDPVVEVSWVSQTFLQLVLLSVIMVGQNVQSAASDARADQTFSDVERLLDLMSTKSDGGLKDILDAVEQVKAERAAQ